MWIKSALGILFCSVLASYASVSNAADYTFDAIAADGQETRYVDGVSQIISRGGRSDIVATLEPDGGKRMRFTLYLVNRGENAIDFFPGDVQASYLGTRLETIPPAQLVKEVTREAGWKRAFAGIVGGLAAGQAGVSAGRSTYTGSATVTDYGRGYDVPARSTIRYNGTVYDPAAEAAARERALDRVHGSLDAISSGADAAAAEIEAKAIRRTTVAPGAELFGDIAIDGRVRDDSDIEVVVKARNDIHILRFKRATGESTHVATAHIPATRPSANGATVDASDSAREDHDRERAFRTLAKLHPDWREIDASDSFKTWLASASPENQALARSSNPYEVAKALTAYKSDQKLSALFQPK